MKKRVLRVLVCGAAGRMGRAVRRELESAPGFAYAGGVDRQPGDGLARASSLPQLLKRAAVVIDFSTPAAACAAAVVCAEAGKPFVTGTTGFSAPQLAALKKAARHVPVFFSPNMSPAVNLTFALAAFTASRLKGFDIHIHETHHKAKKDAPSGTALRYASCIAEARGAGPCITSARVGDVIGEHTVIYAGPHERVELTHRAHSRAVFAAGALKAAVWLRGRKPGFYGYADLLNLQGLL